jgi:hypothetical protein
LRHDKYIFLREQVARWQSIRNFDWHIETLLSGYCCVLDGVLLPALPITAKAGGIKKHRPAFSPACKPVVGKSFAFGARLM